VTSTVSDTERPLRADARRNRDRILQSARAAFAESGADAQIDDVARHAGVGVGTVYRHFPTKQALLTELVRQTFRLFTERAREALQAGGEPLALIEGLLRRIAETAAGDAGVQYALASSDAQAARSQAQAEQDELIAVIAELIERAERAGTIRPGIEATDIAMLICEARVRLAQASRSGDRHAQGALKRDAIRRVRMIAVSCHERPGRRGRTTVTGP
jgi:AcrR family transcriptional regulator